MKFFATAAVLAAIPSFVIAHDAVLHPARHIQRPRQAPVEAAAAGTTSSTAAPAPSTTAASNTPSQSSPNNATPAPTPSGSVSGVSGATGASTTGNSTSLPPAAATTFTFSLEATNPTAIPLSLINSAASSSPTRALATTYAPGSQPTFLPDAPPLPNAALLNPANYPALDKPPPTDSPEVQQWIQDVANSGVNIPNIPVNVLGGCPANPAAAADPTRCWWTCGGCTRETDISDCPQPMQWGLTYDDGPSFYTADLLSYLDQESLKSTFFVVGSRVISFPATLQTQYMGQHQIAVHTWSHPQLTTLSNEEVIAELGWSKKAIKDVLGVTPNMMRPPYGDIDDRVRAISLAMGLTPVMWTRISPMATFDTDDFNIHGGLASVQEVLYNWENIMGNASIMDTGFIVLEHDLFQQSVEVATGYILPDALAHKPPFTIEPVVSCLNKPLSDAYIETNNNKTNPPPSFGGAVVTLSSGAPGSAQATGATKTGSGVSDMKLGLPFGLSLAGIAAGIMAIQL